MAKIGESQYQVWESMLIPIAYWQECKLVQTSSWVTPKKMESPEMKEVTSW